MTTKLKCLFSRICFACALVNQHLYRTKTSSLQIISGICLIFFGIAFALDGAELYANTTYHHFHAIHPLLLSGVLCGVGMLQLVFALRLTERSNIGSGYTLYFNALCWFGISSAYAAGYPPLNPAVLVTGLLGVVCLMTGRGLIEKNDKGR